MGLDQEGSVKVETVIASDRVSDQRGSPPHGDRRADDGTGAQ